MSSNDSVWVRAAIAGILGASAMAASTHLPVAQAADPGSEKVHCWGVNSCKGQGACNGANNSCGGQNSCKGQGWLEMSRKDCTAKGGSEQPQKPTAGSSRASNPK